MSEPVEAPAAASSERRGDRISTAMVVAIAVVSGGLCYALKGPDIFFATFAADARMLLDLLPWMAVALMLAGALFVLLRREKVARWLGAESGFRGLVLAGVAGMLTPGGPMTSFPIAVALITAGSGVPQVVALLSGWSIFTINRFVTWELPVMGGSYAARRMAASVHLPPLAGLMVAGLDRIGWV